MLRQSMPALRTGSYKPVYAKERVVAYLRREGENSVLVVINADDSAQTVTIPLDDAFEKNTELQDQVGPRNFIVEDNKLLEITIPALTGMILA